jgi:hypothetical protein
MWILRNNKGERARKSGIRTTAAATNNSLVIINKGVGPI